MDEGDFEGREIPKNDVELKEQAIIDVQLAEDGVVLVHLQEVVPLLILLAFDALERVKIVFIGRQSDVAAVIVHR